MTGIEEPKPPEGPVLGIEPVSSIPAEGLTRSLKSLITTETLPQQIVYERLFAKSLPQQKRDSYFLTEMYNIKSLIRRHDYPDESADLKLRTSLLKDSTGTKQALQPYYQPTSPEDTTLVFESRFESGNLCLAIKVSEWEYNLFMQNDINTQGHTQWFYFRVTNTRAKSAIKFNILNFVHILFAFFFSKKAGINNAPRRLRTIHCSIAA